MSTRVNLGGQSRSIPLSYGNIPLSYGSIFEEDEQGRSAIPKNMIGMPRRAEEFQNVFEAPMSVKMQHGRWEGKFTNASSKAGRMPRSMQLQRPMAVNAPRRLAHDIMANYAHGLDNTLQIGPPRFNMNTNLMGQPPIPIDPYSMCPVNTSSRGILGSMLE